MIEFEGWTTPEAAESGAEMPENIRLAIEALRTFTYIKKDVKSEPDGKLRSEQVDIPLEDLQFAELPESLGVKGLVLAGLPEDLAKVEVCPQIRQDRIANGIGMIDQPHARIYDGSRNAMTFAYLDPEGTVTTTSDYTSFSSDKPLSPNPDTALLRDANFSTQHAYPLGEMEPGRFFPSRKPDVRIHFVGPVYANGRGGGAASIRDIEYFAPAKAAQPAAPAQA